MKGLNYLRTVTHCYSNLDSVINSLFTEMFTFSFGIKHFKLLQPQFSFEVLFTPESLLINEEIHHILHHFNLRKRMLQNLV